MMPPLTESIRYRTQDGEVLDAICRKFYGNERDVTEQVLVANPDLADVGPVLPAGIVITLPRIEKSQPVKETVRLW